MVSLYRKAVLSEFSLRKPNFVQFPTVYFGGGTPSTMEPEFFYSVLSKVEHFSEVTVEVNPENTSFEYLSALKEVGVNRISLGVQSFSDRVLKSIGRRQKAVDNLKAVETALSVFSNVSIDIIYGAPKESLSELKNDLLTALSFPIKHISLYLLTVYEETPLYMLVKNDRRTLPAEETLSEMYYFIREFLTDRGLKQYEISNFALSGFESKHNISYWHLKNYLGIGPSAASYVEGNYWQNVDSLEMYIQQLKKGKLPKGESIKYNGEEVKELKLMMGLRLIEGVNLQDVGLLDRFNDTIKKSKRLKLLIEENYLNFESPTLRLGKRGLFISNTVIAKVLSELF